MSVQIKCDYENCDTLLDQDEVNQSLGFLTLEAIAKHDPEVYHFCSWECLANSSVLNNNGCNGQQGNCPGADNGHKHTTIISHPYLKKYSAPNTIHPNGSRHHGTVAVETLTERQQLVLGFLAEGYTNAQIATRIGYSESTVHMETLTIYRFLNVHSRKEAVEVAKEQGLLVEEKSEPQKIVA